MTDYAAPVDGITARRYAGPNPRLPPKPRRRPVPMIGGTHRALLTS